MQPLAGEHDAGLHELFVEPAHRRQHLLGGHLPVRGIGIALHQYHDAHRLTSLVSIG